MRISTALKTDLSSESKVISFCSRHYNPWCDRQWVKLIKTALAEQQFSLYLQEVISLTTLEPKRYCEILIRLIDDQGQTVPDSLFLPIAKQYKLTQAIDQWVINTVLDILSETSPTIRESYQFAINISSETLYNDQGWQQLEQEILKRDLPSDLFCFEISESIVLANPQKAANAIANLQMQGYYVTLDQVGGQYSSLNYLNYLCVDYLKIADSFVKDISDPSDRSIVEMIQFVGQQLGIQTIARGVETPQIFQTLIDLDIDYAQGYYLNQPHPLETQLLG